MKLGSQPTTGAADRLGTVFVGAPAACRWTPITVLSMKTSSATEPRLSQAEQTDTYRYLDRKMENYTECYVIGA